MKQLDLGLSIDVDKMDSELRYTEAVLADMVLTFLVQIHKDWKFPKM